MVTVHIVLRFWGMALHWTPVDTLKGGRSADSHRHHRAIYCPLVRANLILKPSSDMGSLLTSHSLFIFFLPSFLFQTFIEPGAPHSFFLTKNISRESLKEHYR